jgi:hypothetical protein
MTAPTRRETPVLCFYTSPGCHLCAAARIQLQQVLEERARAGLTTCRVEERAIGDDPAWQRRYLETIPALALDGRELPLATSRHAIGAFLATALDGNLA